MITFKKKTFNALYSIFAIFSCVALGKLCAYAAPILPGSLYGLIIFTLTLHFRIFNADHIKSSVVWCLKHMGVCFVPAGVGIMNHFELIKQFGIAIVAITFLTTFILLTVVGLHYQRFADDDE
ncbi:CidA/LrgA family protein [Colwellia sp. PAMC 21821]|uniref:CidA/LrgA family protein n=1 Tax=Colwellia sp. PAMC 21821 TaxID=1816219 RepID=UPI001E5EA344|nr:CidA/LrgA family protein [Colwellia sp. PAMC 21821]